MAVQLCLFRLSTVPPTPSLLTSAPVRDFDAEAVMNLLPIPAEGPHVPRLVAPP